MFKITVKNKLLLLLAFCCMSKAQPQHMVKLKGLQKASFKLIKQAGAQVHKHLYWEDIAVAALVCGTAYLVFKHWASDDVIKARYKKERESIALKERFAENIERIELRSYSAVHMPDLFSEDEGSGDEDGFSDLENSTLSSFTSPDGLEYAYNYVHKVNRGIFWDSHRAFIKSERSFGADARRYAEEPSADQPKEEISAKSTEEIMAFEVEARAQELKQKQEQDVIKQLEDEARRKKESEDLERVGSPGREGLGL